jgi:hemerythrin superfamily protein
MMGSMGSVLGKMSPSITNMIRMDHTHVMAAFHQYQADSSARVKKGLVDHLCLALEVHAQLEEEIFYPAMREVSPDEVLDKSKPEHDEMRDKVATLRALQPTDPAFDTTLFDLMRLVMHHVADEETQLLPKAERLLASQLSDLGARMTKRRLELLGPRSGELAGSMARSMSTGTLLAAAGTLAAVGGILLSRRNGGMAANKPAWMDRAKWGR